MPKRNLHFIMRNIAKRQCMFIVICLLRSALYPQELALQALLLSQPHFSRSCSIASLLLSSHCSRLSRC